MNQYIDLHIHSNYSDGLLTVSKIIETAKKNNAKFISITDHDNIDGTIELLLRLKHDSSLRGISGVELSTVYHWSSCKVKIHLLGYNIDINNVAFGSELLEKRNSRKKQNINYTKDMLCYCNIQDDEVFEQIDFSKHSYLQKVLINYFADKGIDCSVLIRYFHEHPIRYVDYDFTFEHALSMIHNAGGLAVLAHPYQTGLIQSDLDQMVSSLVKIGLNGIESIYARATEQDNQFAKYLAQKYNLLETCGSDFHRFSYGNLIAYGKDYNMCTKNCSLVDWLVVNG